MRRLKLIAIVLLALVGCAGEPGGLGSGALGSSSQALDVPGLTPVPCYPSTGYSWEGTIPDLLFADAWAGCSADDSDTLNHPGVFYEPYSGPDEYLAYVRGLMISSMTATNSNPDYFDLFGSWAETRSSATTNCDPLTHELVPGRGLSRTFIPKLFAYAAAPAGQEERYRAADRDVRQAPLDLCIAQRLRKLTPGSAAGQALLLSEADQRQLLELIRERAQSSMMMYALLGSVFMAPPAPTVTYDPNHPGDWLGPPSPDVRIPLLQAAAMFAAYTPDSTNEGHSALETYAANFGTAVQLHSMVAEELLSMMSRSRSAHTPHGTSGTASPSEELWGAGSWYQRAMALVYGGDPLAIGDGGPWEHWDRTSHPDTAAAVEPAGTSSLEWPDAKRTPWPTVAVTEPQVWQLQSLARAHHALHLWGPDPTDQCKLFDVRAGDPGASAQELYDAVEAALRLEQCWHPPSDPEGAECHTAPQDVAPAPGAPLADNLLYQQLKITPAHAQRLVEYLADAVGNRVSPKAGCPQEAETIGASDFSGTVTDLGSGEYDLSDVGELADPTLPELAGTYSRNAVLRYPEPWEIGGTLNPATSGRLWDVRMSDLGFDGSCMLWWT